MSSSVDCELETAGNPQSECETMSVRVSDLALGYSKTLDLTHFLFPYGIFQFYEFAFYILRGIMLQLLNPQVNRRFTSKNITLQTYYLLQRLIED